MPHSLRAKLKYLTICGHIRKKDYERLCKALDNEGVLEKIKEEIKSIRQVDTDGKSGTWYREPIDIINDALQIIDKYRAESSKTEQGLAYTDQDTIMPAT